MKIRIEGKPVLYKVFGAWVCEDFHTPYLGRRSCGLTPSQAYESWKIIKLALI